MVITADMKMADVILTDYELISLLNRIGISLGFKEKTVRTLCEENNIELEYFLLLANAFHDINYIAQNKIVEIKPSWLVQYLRKSHHYYVNYKIPGVQQNILLLQKLVDKKNDNYSLINNFFNEYISEFTSHINLEEQKVFPYIIELENCINLGYMSNVFLKKFNDYSIDKYLSEHDDIEGKLFDLKNILLKYLNPPTQTYEYNSLILEIFHLEEDLRSHTLLEERILIPGVRILEQEVIKLKKH